MKLNKVYGKGKELIVCYKSGHYVSPDDTVITASERVCVEPGAIEGAVRVLREGSKMGETWILKGTYSGDGKTPRVKKAKAPRKAKVPMAEPITVPTEVNERVLRQIEEVAPNPMAAVLLRVSWQNWKGAPHLPLYAGFNYFDADVTAKVRELGEKLVAEFAPIKAASDEG